MPARTPRPRRRPGPAAGLRCIDLFGGFGGSSTGAEMAGADVVYMANHSPVAVATHQRNHPHARHDCQDLRQADFTTLPEYDLMLASPACQGNSSASQPRRRLYHDALRATAYAVLDCADVTNPEAILVENVPGFTSWRLYDHWCDGLRALGYEIDVRIVNASRLHVPQRRRRLFVIATRPGVKVRALRETAHEPAFGPLLQTDVPDDAWTPVSAATPQVQARIAKGRANHGHRFLTQHVTGHPGVPLTEPIRTITTAHSHWNLVDGDHYRALTGRELARGMGFPDTFTWDETLTVGEVTRGIGNAVCPPVMTELVTAVAEALAA